jgi:multidrug efflux pump subunit AcrA (membrane-fusion protein)
LELGAGQAPQPAPASPENSEPLPEGPHWEKPILTGYERAILVKHGDLVEAGQKLVQYSERAQQSVEHEVRRAELAVEEQASLLTRLRKLETSRAISQEELHTATTVFEQAKLTLEQVEIRLADLEVRAPFRGIIRIEATSNSPSISVYPVEESQALRYWRQGDETRNSGE